MNILLTGSTGFVGSALVPKLEGNHRLVCPGRTDLDSVNSPVELDLAVKKENIEFIVHLAHPRLPHILNSMSEAIMMLRNILEVCRLNNIPLLYLSSLAVFTGYHNLETISPETRPLPEGVYGQTKYLCEKLIESYEELYGLKAVLLRPSYIYGPGMDKSRVIYKFIDNAKRNVRITVHKYVNGFQVLDYLHKEDLAEAIVASLKQWSFVRETINVGTGTGTSILQLAELIRDLSNSRSEIEIVSINNKTSNLVVDPAQGFHLLGWRARTALSEALGSLI
ncbi:MAG: NAD(P)-dependent oxidoreductase [Candidatus Atabeyarchaeum deiterrae]